MRKVAIYVRVSTREQAEEGYSIGAQLEKLRLYCQAKGWIVVEEYVDAGESGGNIDRPAMKKLIKDIGSKSFDMILVYKLDRLSRSQKDTLYLVEDVFHPADVKFTSMMENFDTSTSLGMAMLGILSVFAQLERAQIKERMQMGRDARAQAGLYHGGGNVAIGYSFEDDRLVIDDYEAMQVRKIFQLFLDGESIQSIRNIMHRSYTTKYGSYTTSKTIRSILTNPTYIGKIRHGSQIYDGMHDPIIDDETWEKVQKKYEIHCKTAHKPSTTPFSRTTLLGGLIYCAHCGARYGGQVNSIKKGNCSKKYPIYACYTRRGNKNMAKGTSCKNKNYKRAELEEAIWDEILKLSIEIEDPESKIFQSDEDDRDLIEKRIKQIDSQIMKMMDLYSLGSMPVDMISKKIQMLNDEKESLLDELDQIDDKEDLDPQEVINQLRTAEEIKEKGTPEEQKALLEYLIDKIVIDDDDVTIHWKFD